MQRVQSGDRARALDKRNIQTRYPNGFDAGARSDLDLLIVVRGHPIRSRPAAELRPKPEYRRRILDNSRKGSFAWLNRDTDLR